MMRDVMVLSLVFLASSVWAGTYSDGLGTEASPYQISTVADWLELIATEDDWDKHFELTNDIDFGGMELTPVGYWISDSEQCHFGGKFNGNSHALRNIVINSPTINNVGLFGLVNHGGEIRNFKIENINVTGARGVGGLVGSMGSSELLNCKVIASVTGTEYVGGLVGWSHYSLVENSAASGIVTKYATATATYLGGLIGSAWSSDISRCYAAVDVVSSSSSLFTGGLVGYMDSGSKVIGCYSTGDIVGSVSGGLVGENYRGKIIHSYSTGKPSGSEPQGGLVGSKTTGDGYEDTGNFWDTETSQRTTSAMGVGKTTAEMQTISTFTSAGWDFVNAWAMPAGGGYPILQWQIAGRGSLQVFILPQSAVDGGAQWRLVGTETWFSSEAILDDLTLGNKVIEFKPAAGLVHPRVEVEIYDGQLTTVEVTYKPPYSGGSGTEEEPFEIATVSDWLELTQTEADWDKHFILLNDIDFDGVHVMPIGNVTRQGGTINGLGFQGVLDGGGYALKNIIVDMPEKEFVGVFGRLYGAQIRNLGIENIAVTGLNYVGGLTGYVSNGSMVSDCFVTGNLVGKGTAADWYGGIGGLAAVNSGTSTVTQCYFDGIVSGQRVTGGLIGFNPGTVQSCFSRGQVYGDAVTGGLVGQNQGSVLNSYSSCVADSEDFMQVAGLVGTNAGGSIIRCYSTGKVTRTLFPEFGGGKMPGEGLAYNLDYISFVDTGNFWDMESSETDRSDMGVGKTTVQMQNLWTFKDVGWDFVNVWQMPVNDYPRLAWEQLEPYCGDANHPYPLGDLDKNCRVDLADLALFAANWLVCTDPSCVTE